MPTDATLSTPPGVEPDDERIFVTPLEASQTLAISRSQVYDLLNRGVIDSRFFGRRRLVVLDSLREFADNLPSERAS
jgi:excisionase family DNA binding protein